MPDSDALTPTEPRSPALTGPETTAADPAPTGPDPLASPAEAATDDGPFTLETTLLGPLALPAGAASGPELDELSRRAASMPPAPAARLRRCTAPLRSGR